MNDSKLIEAFHNSTPWRGEFLEPLETLEFKDSKKAWEVFLSLSDHCDFLSLFPNFFASLLEELSSSYQPDLALYNFERFTATIRDKNYLYTLLSSSPRLLHSIIVLFSGSQILTDSLLSDPSLFDWLNSSNILTKSKSCDDYMRDFYELTGEDYPNANTPELLLKFKKREYIRIGLRDLIGKTDFRETGKEISFLADVCLQIAYDYADQKLRKKHGIPFYKDSKEDFKEAEFAVIGMGKLGGLELNFSSDIDLLYIYTSSKGETQPTDKHKNIASISIHEYFTKLALLITKLINEITSEGSIFRVDLDLRPEGKSGEVVNSLTSCEIYYQSWGQTWERQALIKARVSAGSESLGASFIKLVEPFVYRQNLDFSAIDQIKHMKKKITKSLGKKYIGRDIKLGSGGIREVEFTLQAYQLLFGSRIESLRIPNTLDILEELYKLGFISTEDYKPLKEAYYFLRNLENMVQISHGIQTHLLPQDDAQLATLALKMKIEGKTNGERSKNLMLMFVQHTKFVDQMFSQLFDSREKRNEVKIYENIPSSTQELNIEALEKVNFGDPKKALKFLETLRDGSSFSHPSEKSIVDFYILLPKILEFCNRIPSPNSAVENLVRFIEASRSRESFLSLLRNNEKLLELLLIIFGSSDFLSEILIRQPEITDAALDLESIHRFKYPEKIAEDLKKGFNGCKNFEEIKACLRKIKYSEELRIGIRHLIGEANLKSTLTDLSSLAQICLQSAYLEALSKLCRDYDREHLIPINFAIIGMGKLGGRELNFGSDLDILFVYEITGEELLPKNKLTPFYDKLVQLVYNLISEITSSGYAYKIDASLRPEGRSGVLVNSIESYKKYFINRASPWERQALTRARFVAGNEKTGKKFLNTSQSFVYDSIMDYGSLVEISRLRERMEIDLANEAIKGKNIKLGFGALADIEFAVQVLQLIHGGKNSLLRSTNIFESITQLGSLGFVDHHESEMLKRNYLFLRNLECSLRIFSPLLGNHLPKNQEALQELAKLLGYEKKTGYDSAENLMQTYLQKTTEVRLFYQKIIGTLLRTFF